MLGTRLDHEFFLIFGYFRGTGDFYNSPLFSITENESDLLLVGVPKLSSDAKPEFERRLQDILNGIEANSFEGRDLEAAYYNAGLYYQNLGEYKLSYNSFLQAIEVEPKNRVTWVSLGETLQKMEAFESSERAFIKAIDINPGAYDNYLKLTKLYKQTEPENIEKIKQVYVGALKILVNTLAVRKDYASWLFANNMLDEAKEQYTKLLTQDPASKSIYQEKLNSMQ